MDQVYPANATVVLRASPQRRRRVIEAAVVQSVVFSVALALGCVFLLPFFWMLSTSVKAPDEVFTFPMQWLPRSIQWENYPRAFTAVPYLRFVENTLTVVVFAMIGEVLSSTLCAYGFARLRFVGRDVLFVAVLATMMLPEQVTMIPVFVVFRWLGWVDTFLPLIVPAYFGHPFYIFLLRQFFMTIPTELEDAARIDGASSFQILRQIMIPLSMPALATVAIFSFIYHWNDFLHPLLYLSSKDMKTLALGLALFKGEYSNDWNLMMAASVIALMPCLTIFFLAQRYFIEGITMTGLKQ